MLQFKIANFTRKILNNKGNIPAVFSDFITLAASVQSYETRCYMCVCVCVCVCVLG